MRTPFLWICCILLPLTCRATMERGSLALTPSEANLSDTPILSLDFRTAEKDLDLSILEWHLLIAGPTEATPPAVALVDAGATKEGDTYHYVALFALDPASPGTFTLSFGVVPLTQELTLDSDTVTLTVEPPPPQGNLLESPLLPLPGRPLIGVNTTTWEQLSGGPDHRDDRSERHRNRFQQRSFPWRLVSILGVASILVWLLRRQLRAFAHKVHTKRQDPAAEALAALRALQASHLPQKGLFDSYYVELTNIVRHYIENKFGLHAPEQTTEEFLQRVRRDEVFDLPTEEKLKNFLFSADLVKFARKESDQEECDHAFSAAIAFVNSDR